MKKNRTLFAVYCFFIAFLLLLFACALDVPETEQEKLANNISESSLDEDYGNNGNQIIPFSSVFEVPSSGYDGSDVTITFYHTMGTNLSTVLDDYIVEFNKLYPNIHVSWEAIGSYDDVRDQISTQIFVGSQPNIAAMIGPVTGPAPVMDEN